MRSMGAMVRRLAGPALLVAVEILAAGMVLAAATSPAAAQFGFQFFDQRPRRQQQQTNPYGWPWQQQQQWPEQRREAPVDFSKAPPPRKREAPPTTNIVVVGDAMADWLAYGLEEAFAESPEIGITRKPRANRGLIKIEGRSEGYDAVAAMREILAGEKPDFVVMMTGLADRQSIRERPTRGAQPQPGQPQPNPAQPAQAQPNQPHAQQATPPAAQPPAPPGDAEAAGEDPPAIIAPESGPSGSATHPFRSEKWADLYAKRIDETIAVLKSKGAPVLWVGLPAIRGTRSTSEMVYLNDLYRSRAEKAGIVYVDVWDGFVDEDGSFVSQGPDFEGQTRRLRAGDGVHFTKAGARKLAHYVEREIRRVMLARGAPVAMPVPDEKEPPAQAPAARPGVPAARPVAGPVVSLTGQPSGSEALVGGGPARGASTDPVASKVLVKGEPVPAPAGRADNFAWPRQDALPAAVVGATEPNPESAATATPPAGSKPAGAAPGAKSSPTGAEAPKRRAMRVTPPPFAREDQPRPPGSVPNNNSWGWGGWR
jgi:uncharacterized protein